MKGDNHHRSYECGKCAHVLNRGDWPVELPKMLLPQLGWSKLVEVVTGAGVGAGQVTDGKTASEEMM